MTYVGDGDYVIRSASDPTKYLSVTASSSAEVNLTTVSGDTIPDSCRWKLSNSAHGGVLIRNDISYIDSNGNEQISDHTLYHYNNTLAAGALPSSSNSRYDRYVWRIASTDYYGNTASHTKRELSASTIIENIEDIKGENRSLIINEAFDELWVSYNDFVFSIENDQFVSYSNGEVNLLQNGGTKIVATHKVTNRTKIFYVLVGFSTTIDSTPLASHITEGLSQPCDVWPASEESVYYSHDSLYRAERLRDIYLFALATIAGGNLTGNPAAADMLDHFLKGDGELYDVGMRQVLNEWTTAQNFMIRDINYAMRAAEAAATFTSNTFRTIIPFGCSVNEDSNWGRAIGSYTTSIATTYRQTSSNTYTMQVTYELHDVYDWDPSITSMGWLPVSPRDMWELHHGGMANNYEVYGSDTFTINWTKGENFEEATIIYDEE